MLFRSFIVTIWLLLTCTSVWAQPQSSKDKHGREPEQVFLLYIHSCKQGELEKAASLCWLRDGAEPAREAYRFKQVQNRIAHQEWDTKVLAKAVDAPYAAIIFTTREDRSNPEPVFLAMIEDEWRLHHQNISGGLSRITPDEHTGKIAGLIRWGNDAATRIRQKAQRDAK